LGSAFFISCWPIPLNRLTDRPEGQAGAVVQSLCEGLDRGRCEADGRMITGD
jgi:hypothetical protein